MKYPRYNQNISVLGFDDPGLNLIKNHQWRITRIRAVTSYNEGMDFLKSAVLDIGLQYIGAKFGVNPAAKQAGKILNTKFKFPRIKEGYGVFGKEGYLTKRYKIEALYQYKDSRYGTILSVKERIGGGNLFRLDYGPHSNVSKLHYHYRWRRNSIIKGSTDPKSVFSRRFIERTIITGGVAGSLKGDSKKMNRKEVILKNNK